METLYTICAIVGGTLFLCQLVMMTLGLGGDHDVDHDVGGGDHDASHSGDHDQSHGFGLSSLFTLKTLVVGVTLFGLTGRAMASSELAAGAVMGISMGAGFLGLFLMALVLHGLTKLEAEGTVHIHQALGEQASVYLSIPPHGSGQGKITVTVQNRSMEYRAVTDGDAIPTGATVEVVDLLDDDIVKVAVVSKPNAALNGATANANNSLEKKDAPADRTIEGGTHV